MTPRTIGFLAIFTLSCLVVPLAAEAQQATKVHRIGYLIAGSSPAGPDPRLHDFRQGLRDLGYVEGQNLIIGSCTCILRIIRSPKKQVRYPRFTTV
jgi:hypothetical protein